MNDLPNTIKERHRFAKIWQYDQLQHPSDKSVISKYINMTTKSVEI